MRGDFFTIRILKNNLHKKRFAVLVPKKVSQKATKRNKTKRTLREARNKKIDIFPDGSDCVLYAHPNSLYITLASSMNLLEKMLKKR